MSKSHFRVIGLYLKVLFVRISVSAKLICNEHMSLQAQVLSRCLGYFKDHQIDFIPVREIVSHTCYCCMDRRLLHEKFRDVKGRESSKHNDFIWFLNNNVSSNSFKYFKKNITYLLTNPGSGLRTVAGKNSQPPPQFTWHDSSDSNCPN